MTVRKIFIRFCKSIGKFCNELNKHGGGDFFKIGKRDFTFIREMRVRKFV